MIRNRGRGSVASMSSLGIPVMRCRLRLPAVEFTNVCYVGSFTAKFEENEADAAWSPLKLG